MSFFGDILSRLPSANEEAYEEQPSSLIATCSAAESNDRVDGDFDDDLMYNFPEVQTDGTKSNMDDGNNDGCTETNVVDNFAFFLNNDEARIDGGEFRRKREEEQSSVDNDDDHLPDDCFWTRYTAIDSHDDDPDAIHQVDKICTAFHVDRSSLDRFLPMYNVAVNISTRMQYDRFTFLLILVPVDDDRRLLRLFAVRTFVDHEAELVRDILAFVGQRLFSRLFATARRAHFNGTLSAELSRMFARASASGDNTHTRRLYLPSVFAYVVDVDEFLDQICTSSNTDSKQVPPAFALLKQSRDKLLDLSRRVLDDPTVMTNEMNTLKSLNERLRSRTRKRSSTSNNGDYRILSKRAKHGQNYSHDRDDDDDDDDDDKRAIRELINDEPEYWSERLNDRSANDPSTVERDTMSASGSNFCTFVKFAERLNDPSPLANLDELCNRNDAVSSLAEAHVLFFQRYESFDEEQRQRTSNVFLVEMTRSAFHAIDPLLFDRTRLGRDIASVDALTSGFLAGLQIEYFAARNKLNDIHRHVYLRHMEIERPRSFDYATELNFSKNFVTYFDYYEMVNSVETMLDHVPYIDASRILVPLEWLSNKLVRQALCSWSGYRFDFDIVPSSAKRIHAGEISRTYDFKRFVVCDYTRSRNYRLWSDYVRRVQRQSSLIFDIDPSPLAPPVKRPVPSLTVRELLFGRDGGDDDACLNVAASSTLSALFSSPAVNDQSSSTTVGTFIADVASVLDGLATKCARSGGGRFRSDTNSNNCANWIFSFRGRFYGVNGDTFRSTRAVRTINDLDKAELHERSYIRLAVVKKMPRNSGGCVIWTPTNCSTLLTTAQTTSVNIETRDTVERSPAPFSVEEINSSSCSPFANIATSVLHAAANRDKSATLAVDNVEPSVVDFLRRFVDEHNPCVRSLDTLPSDLTDLRAKLAACLEQILFLDVLLRRSEPRFAVLVNGNPGTGKSTVMKYITRMVSRDSFTLLPTNVLREQVTNSLTDSYEPLADCPTISLVRRPVLDRTVDQSSSSSSDVVEDASSANNDGITDGAQFVDDQPVVLTVSSFIKRALRYNLGPDVYSKIVQRYLDQQLERLRLTLRPLSMTRDLFPLEKPIAGVLYPPVMQVDEYNLCTYSEHFVVARACQQMCVSRICYGDFAQSSPIRGSNDNAELIALFAPLTVQFLDNKRLLNLTNNNAFTIPPGNDRTSITATDSPSLRSHGVNLHTLLNDPIWNWKANNCDDGTNDYVRRLIASHVVHPIFDANVEQRFLSSEVPIDVAEFDRWYDSVARLNDWFDEKPCRRFVADAATLDELVRRHYPTFQLPCFISRRNLDSDRINYWLSRAIADYVTDRCASYRASRGTSGIDDDTAGRSASRSFDKCFCLAVRRSAIACGDALKTSAHEIVRRAHVENDDTLMDRDDAPPVDVHVDEGFTLAIDDDPWCADLSLILGAVYRYIGPATKFMCSDSLLRLVAFLPECQLEPSNGKKNNHRSATGYRCNDQDCSLDCVGATSEMRQKLHTLEKLGSTHSSVTVGATAVLPMTLGCGLPFLAHSDTVGGARYVPAYPRLLMQRLHTRDDVAPSFESNLSSSSSSSSSSSASVNGNSFVVLSRSKFTLNRCNSKWTNNLYTNQPKREGICLFGYPLVLNCGVSSWRVQGETIPTSRVFVDLKHMNKQQALVSLSRVRRSEQIGKVINVNLYAR